MKRFCIVLCILSILHGSFSAKGLSINKKWTSHIDNRYSVVQTYFANNKVYIATDYSKISCFDFLTGNKLWDINNCCSILKVVSGKTYFLDYSSTPFILCVDEINGNVLWKQRIFDSKLLFSDDSIYVVQQDLDDKYMICRYDLYGLLLSKYKNNDVIGYTINHLDGDFVAVRQITSNYIYQDIHLDKNTLEFKGINHHILEVRNLLDSVFIDNYCILTTNQSKDANYLSLYDKKVKTKYWSIKLGKERFYHFHEIINHYLYILTTDSEYHNRLYCLDIKSGKIVWKFTMDSLFNCHIFNNCISIIDSDRNNSPLSLYTLDVKTGAILKTTAFTNNEMLHWNGVVNGKIYTSYKQNDKYRYEIIDIVIHNILEAFETDFNSRILVGYTNHILIGDNFTRKYYLINLDTNQLTAFENCSNYLFSIENQFLFYNEKDKLLECHVTTGDL